MCWAPVTAVCDVCVVAQALSIYDKVLKQQQGAPSTDLSGPVFPFVSFLFFLFLYSSAYFFMY